MKSTEYILFPTYLPHGGRAGEEAQTRATSAAQQTAKCMARQFWHLPQSSSSPCPLLAHYAVLGEEKNGP